jgi:hypothetical protein
LLTDDAARSAVKWPLDPPPVIEYILHDGDAKKAWLQSPYFFCNVQIRRVKGQEPLKTDTLSGALSSSLHKVKLPTNKGPKSAHSPRRNAPEQHTEHGFFVFGDLYVKYPGTYQLRFTAWEMRQGYGKAGHWTSLKLTPL